MKREYIDKVNYRVTGKGENINKDFTFIHEAMNYAEHVSCLTSRNIYILAIPENKVLAMYKNCYEVY